MRCRVPWGWSRLSIMVIILWSAVLLNENAALSENEPVCHGMTKRQRVLWGTAIWAGAISSWGYGTYLAANGQPGLLYASLLIGTLGTISMPAEDKGWSCFIEENRDALAIDFSRGFGEHLNALASLLQCSISGRQELARTVQLRWENLFPETIDPNSSLHNRLAVIAAENAELVEGCKGIGSLVADSLATQ